MNSKVIKALYKKEIFDVLRDKKTLLMMIVIPLVLYPLMFVLSMYFASSMITESTTHTYMIGYENFTDADKEIEILSEKASERGYDFVFMSISDDVTSFENYEDALKRGFIDAYITEGTAEGKQFFEIHYKSSDNTSSNVASMIADVFKGYQEYVREEKVTDLGQDPEDILYSVQYGFTDISTNEETVGNLFGYIVPFLLIASVLMGAMYPAIDLTAGEKERGTLETLLTLPVKNLELIFSKFLATTTIATASAFLNVLSMGIVGVYFYSSMASTGSIAAGGFSFASYIPSVLITLVCACIFAMFCSAICLLVCIFAKSFKEAQNYSTPIMVVIMIAGMASMLPALNLNDRTAWIPVINTALLISKLFTFELDAYLVLKVLFANLAYSLIIVVIMARLFNSEGILFGDGSEGIRLIERRSDMRDKQIPGYGDLILLFSILLIVVMMAGSLLVIRFGIFGLIMEQLLIALVTIGYGWYIKTDRKKVFSVSWPGLQSFFAGTIMWFGMYIIMMVLTVAFTFLFPESSESASADLLVIWQGQPFILIVISSAVFPAVCEEIAFRGFFFGTLKNRLKILPAIILTGIIFGAFHMNFIKLFVVGLLGGILAYCVYRSGSILTSMWMHFLNNFMAVFIAYKSGVLSGNSDSYTSTETELLENLGVSNVIIVLIAGLLFTAVGFIWFEYIGKARRKREADSIRGQEINEQHGSGESDD